jgi:hypothetical protein
MGVVGRLRQSGGYVPVSATLVASLSPLSQRVAGQQLFPVTDLLATLERTLGGTYTFEREIVGGSMSRVFLAMDRSLGREIIVKVLSLEVAADLSVDRFRREIQLAARLQHPIRGGKGYCVLLGLGITSPPGANLDGFGDFVDSA